jgi:hypothetical protein
LPADTALVAYLDPLISEAAGTDLFEGPMTELPDNCVAITLYGGEEGDRVMAASLVAPDTEPALVQLMVRNANKTTAATRAAAIHALLDNLGPVTLGGVLYHNVVAQAGAPRCLGQDDNGRWRYVADYLCTKARG